LYGGLKDYNIEGFGEDNGEVFWFMLLSRVSDWAFLCYIYAIFMTSNMDRFQKGKEIIKGIIIRVIIKRSGLESFAGFY
jgi:hypothetical protein